MASMKRWTALLLVVFLVLVSSSPLASARRTKFPTRRQTTFSPSSQAPTASPTTLAPTTLQPTFRPTTQRPTKRPTLAPTKRPTTRSPTKKPTVDLWLCNNLCPSKRDGRCDDGGPGSTSFQCIYGSDCQDCGVRVPYTTRPTTSQAPTPLPSRPTSQPTLEPTAMPSKSPTLMPTRRATKSPTKRPTRPTPRRPKTFSPTWEPTTQAPSTSPTTPEPTARPTTGRPTKRPTTAYPTTGYPTKKPTPLPWDCNELCVHSNDGKCDDGGGDSVTRLCTYGTDCLDCGRRSVYTESPTTRNQK